MTEKAKEKLIIEYTEQVNLIKSVAKDINLNENDTDLLFKDVFKILKSDIVFKKHTVKTAFVFLIRCLLYFCTFIIILRILISHQLFFSFIMRNIQGWIYPCLKILRLFSVPVITNFPTLSNLYDKSCLISNPYFRVPNMDCWPCENVHTVVNATGVHDLSLYQSGIPYTRKSNQTHVNLELVKKLYRDNKAIFDNDASKLYYSNDPKYKNIYDVSNLNDTKDVHIVWRIDRMAPSRTIRKLFPTPKGFGSPRRSGQSTERFLVIVGSNVDGIVFPDTECSYAFAIQGEGEQSVILRPTAECADTCRRISVVLKPTDILFYNWWYWKPIGVPSENSSSPLIMYIGSFC